MAATEEAANLNSSFSLPHNVSDGESADLQKSGSEESEGKRMRQFRMVMQKCVDKILASGGRSEKLKSCFAAIQKKDPKVFGSITQQLMQHLKTNIEKEIELMIKQEDLVHLLNELDHVMEESGESTAQAAWRPSREPSADSRDHLMPIKMKYRDQLRSMLHQVEEENEHLKALVLPKRQRLRESESSLSSRAQDLAQAAEFCEEVDLKNLELWVDHHK